MDALSKQSLKDAKKTSTSLFLKPKTCYEARVVKVKYIAFGLKGEW